MKGPALLQGEIITKYWKYIDEIKNLLLQNHWANFNQTWNKAYLIEGNLGFFKWRAHPFPRGDNYEIVKIHWRNKKIFFSRNTEPISTKHGSKHPWVEGIQVCSNEGPRPFPRGDNYEIVKIHRWNLKNPLLQNHWANFKQSWHKASLGEGDSCFFFQMKNQYILIKLIMVFFLLLINVMI